MRSWGEGAAQRSFDLLVRLVRAKRFFDLHGFEAAKPKKQIQSYRCVEILLFSLTDLQQPWSSSSRLVKYVSEPTLIDGDRWSTPMDGCNFQTHVNHISMMSTQNSVLTYTHTSLLHRLSLFCKVVMPARRPSSSVVRITTQQERETNHAWNVFAAVCWSDNALNQHVDLTTLQHEIAIKDTLAHWQLGLLDLLHHCRIRAQHTYIPCRFAISSCTKKQLYANMPFAFFRPRWRNQG